MKRYLIVYILLIISGIAFCQVDPQLSQFYANPLYIAPSFAGGSQVDRVSLSYRDQFPKLSNTYVTYAMSYDHYFPTFNSGVGVLFLNDVQGTGKLSTTTLSLQYSYNIKATNNWFIRPGLQFGMVQTGLDYNSLLFPGDMSPGGNSPTSVVPPNDNTADVDFGASCLFFNKQYWFGVDVNHLLKPNVSLYNDEVFYDVKYSLFGGVQLIKPTRRYGPQQETVTLTYLYKHQGTFDQLDVGMYWYSSPLVLGLWVRGIPGLGEGTGLESLIFLVGFKTEALSIGYSYDFTISSLGFGTTGGAHEISMMYEFSLDRAKLRPRKRYAIPCPEF